MALNEYRKYNTSLVEVVLERLKSLYDVELESHDFDYIKSSEYTLTYLKYVAPGNGDIDVLLDILNLFNENKYLIVNLPLAHLELNTASKEDSFDEILEKFDVDVKEEVLKNKETPISQMSDHDPYNNYPLLIENMHLLTRFFSEDSEEIEHYFIGDVLLFPIDMNWFLHFDYDLGAIHFASKNHILEEIRNGIDLDKITYSVDEVNQLISEAMEDM